jgi:hypothetical protein
LSRDSWILIKKGIGFEPNPDSNPRPWDDEVQALTPVLLGLLPKTQFEVEITYEMGSGGISLKGKQFYNNKLEDSTFSIEFDGNKVQSPTIQDNYRYIKPSTLLEKLKVYSERAKTLFEEYKKKTSLKQNIIEKYTKLYPNATITIKREWNKYNGDFEVIEVKFASGSYVQFRLDTYNNKEYLYKKHDAEALSVTELLEKFSKQEALN